MTLSNVTGFVKSVRDIMREDRGISGDGQRIEQLAWMLFLRIHDAKDEELEYTQKGYKSPIPKNLQWREWAGDDEGMTGDDLLDFVDKELFPRLRSLRGSDARSALIRDIFQGVNNYMKSGIQLRKVLNKINGVDFQSQGERHLFGDIYETILKELQTAGAYGEFYTPRPVTQFMVDMIDPKLDEVILDPACGTGGFLTCHVERLKKKARNVEQRKSIERNLRGWEWKPLPHVLATTNLILHDIEHPNIAYRDALDKPLSAYVPKDRVDIITANPPFGGTVANENEKNFPLNYRTKESADLFLVLMIHLLKDGGRAAIVLPDGSLTGEGVKQRVREKWLTDCDLHTVVRLPNSVFAPYATVATNLLFFTKGRPTKEVWYYEHRMPEGQKAYSKTKPIERKEFDPIEQWWKKRAESEVCWKVPISAIRERGYDLDIKNPNRKEEEGLPSSSELIERMLASVRKTEALLNEIKAAV